MHSPFSDVFLCCFFFSTMLLAFVFSNITILFFWFASERGMLQLRTNVPRAPPRGYIIFITVAQKRFCSHFLYDTIFEMNVTSCMQADATTQRRDNIHHRCIKVASS